MPNKARALRDDETADSVWPFAALDARLHLTTNN